MGSVCIAIPGSLLVGGALYGGVREALEGGSAITIGFACAFGVVGATVTTFSIRVWANESREITRAKAPSTRPSLRTGLIYHSND